MKQNKYLIPFAIILLTMVNSCELFEETVEPNEPVDTEYALGWIGDDDLSTIPSSTNFGFGNGNLPSSVDLTSKFPPIGDQNPYGTCVSWAVAYNAMTAIRGIKNNLSSSQLSLSSNQFSPKDLFIAIPDHLKGASDCNGTNFTSALDVVQSRGVASMQTVPYSSLNDCSQSNLNPNWTSEANQNKIKYWRKIEASIYSIKQNLSNNIPIIFGARLSDNFMSWRNGVLSSSSSFNQVGIHAYHAMVISGYDDSKGANGAFKVINSWGQNWGDFGYIWIDYNYFISEFCKDSQGNSPLFIIDIDEGNVTPPNDPDPVATGVDLAPWVFSDYSTYQSSGWLTERSIDFNVYNIGSESASPSTNWSFYYIYYNAYNANDYGVLFYDNFNTSVSPNTFNCPFDYNCIFNYTIPSGGSFTQTVWGVNSQSRTYYMPQITGSYYLALIVDADDSFAEQNELNNIFYTTTAPKQFNNGYANIAPGGNNNSYNDNFEFSNSLSFDRSILNNHQFISASNEQKNAYTPAEITNFIKREKLNGNLDNKVNQAIQRRNRNY